MLDPTLDAYTLHWAAQQLRGQAAQRDDSLQGRMTRDTLRAAAKFFEATLRDVRKVQGGDTQPAVCTECERLRAGHIGPSHRGSRHCKSGSIASGGRNAHCSCNVCW